MNCVLDEAFMKDKTVQIPYRYQNTLLDLVKAWNKVYKDIPTNALDLDQWNQAHSLLNRLFIFNGDEPMSFSKDMLFTLEFIIRNYEKVIDTDGLNLEEIWDVERIINEALDIR